MKVTITGRHIKLGDDIKSYAEGKMHKSETFFDRIIEGSMILSAEKHRRIAEVTLTAKRAKFYAQEETEDIFASIDGVMEKIDTQIRRHKEKIKDKKHHPKEDLYVLEEDSEEEEEPEIVKVNKFAPKPLSPQEAAMQIELTRNDFLMFSNSQTNEVNVIYRRKDGNYGLIEPDFE